MPEQALLRYRKQLNYWLPAENALQVRIADHILERLSFIQIKPAKILILGGNPYSFYQKVQEAYPEALLVIIDNAEKRLQQQAPASWLSLCAEITELPLRPGQFDLIISNLALHWLTKPQKLFQQINQLLTSKGCLLFSTFGPDTLIELRQTLADCDTFPHIANFLDMHDLGDQLLQAKLQNPVMDVERHTVSFPHLATLLNNIKMHGESYCQVRKGMGLKTATFWQRVEQLYPKPPIGPYTASVEIAFGHAWAGQIHEHLQPLAAGQARISLAALKAQLLAKHKDSDRET